MPKTNTGIDTNSMADAILDGINHALQSDFYRDMIRRQNNGLGAEVYYPPPNLMQNPLLPAVGISYDGLTDHIKTVMRQRFGNPIAFLHEHENADPTILNTLCPNITLLDPNSRFTDADCTSFVPYDIDEQIREWLMTGNSLDTFLENMTDKYCIFHRSSAEQEKYIQLDIFFTALHQKLQKLPKSSRIAEDFSKSIYINPDFIGYELSEMLPFYEGCNYCFSDSSTLTIIINESRKKNKNFSGMDYPLMGETICLSDSNSYEATPEVLSDFIDDYMNECSRRSNNKKILKNCYPLYLFLFNNILTTQIIKSPSSISKVSGCSLNNPEYNLNPLKDMLKLQISPLKNMNINDKRSLYVKSNLYALRQFDYYIQTHPYLRFSCTLRRKIGNNHKQSVQNVDVFCDPLFTIWLFIRYSELFKIALTTKFLMTSTNDTK